MADVLALLSYYRFEFGESTPARTISDWLDKFPANWVRLAIVEALYQGRYKAVSVTQILAAWQRRDQPYPHFNYEFESLVCRHVQMPVRATEVDRDSEPDRPDPPHPEPIEVDVRAQSEEHLIDEGELAEEQAPSDSPEANGHSENETQPAKIPIEIDRFSPTVDGSGFYIRLKTIAEKSQPEGDGSEEETD